MRPLSPRFAPLFRAVPTAGHLAAAAALLLAPPAAAQTLAPDLELAAPAAAVADGFGAAIAIDGERAAVGAAGEGAVHVLERAGGTWVFAAELAPPDGVGDAFGSAVALSGTRLVVGATRDDEGGLDAGAVHVLELGPAGWAPVAKLVASDARPGDLFGSAVALSGDRLVVGAPTEADLQGPPRETGAAYVFELGPDGWVETAKLLAADGDDGHWFGASVALEGGTALVGAPYEVSPWFLGGPWNGAAYVFEVGAGGWTQTGQLTAADGDFGEHFGASVALEGDLAVVGAPRHVHGFVESGAAYAFARTEGGWTQEAEILPAEAGTQDGLGGEVALSDGRVIVGAERIWQTYAYADAVWLFEREPSGWSEIAKLQHAEPAEIDQFGGAIGFAGGRALVGVVEVDVHGAESAGAVLAYDLAFASCTARAGALATNPADLACTGEPRLGATWTAAVATAPLVGAATATTLLAVGLGGPVEGVPVLGFELLALPPYAPLAASATGAFALPIPPDEALLGASFAAQGARLESGAGGTVVVLTNAQDVVVGL